jgi:hypothetical protein
MTQIFKTLDVICEPLGLRITSRALSTLPRL